MDPNSQQQHASQGNESAARQNSRQPREGDGQGHGATSYASNQKKSASSSTQAEGVAAPGETANGKISAPQNFPIHPNASKAISQASPGEPQNTIGHYVLVKALGEGTFGKVKLGTHILTGEKVAVKVLEKSRIKEKKDVERISREIKILKQLHHPNVVQIYEIIETEQDLYLVMEFVQGGELFDLIVQNQRLKERQACKYFQELISGINYIHQLGICHRDLKPENLLIDYDQSLKIVDFGLSNLYEPGTTLKTACGSPCYAAPEMIAGKNYNGLMSDLWSCGVVLYAMLCGYLPFEDQRTSDLYKKILNAEYQPPDFLSDEAKDMIARIFVTDPSQRIDIEGIRKHPWYQLHRPETMGFHVCPPAVQRTRPDYIIKNNKKFSITQRFNLLNQKIIGNLEAQQGFNRESLLKSIKNNKHNHLTATYYLLLKKHMIRQLKPYSDAFMELKPYEEQQDQSAIQNRAEAATKDKYGNAVQAPQVHLKSKQVQDALQQKRGAALADQQITISERQQPQLVSERQELAVKQGGVHASGGGHDEARQTGQKPSSATGMHVSDSNEVAKANQKDFRSLDHNQLADSIIGKQANKIDSSKNITMRQNYMDGSNGFNDYVDQTKQQYIMPSQHHTDSKGVKYSNQSREKQSSRLSNRSSSQQQQQEVVIIDEQAHLRDVDEINDVGEAPRVPSTNPSVAGAMLSQQNQFNGQTQQTFAQKKPKPSKNAFNHRREYSANPYIGNDPTSQEAKEQNFVGQGARQQLIQEHKQNNQHMEQYQTQIDKYKKASGGPMQPQPTKTRNSRWKPQDSSVNNSQSDLSSMRSQNTKHMKKSQERIVSYRQVNMAEDNQMGPNGHPSDFGNQYGNAYQTQGKPRAQSYNNKRRGDNSGSLDPLEYEKEGENERQNEEQFEYIKSNNMKQTTKGHHREVRAPSSGSSGSQPRVVIAGPNKDQGSGSHTSVNSTGVQRRYDSIEHQRQSQIDKFLQSPQEQIANIMMIQKLKQQDQIPSGSKFSKKNLTVSNKDNHRKNASETFNQGLGSLKGNLQNQMNGPNKIQQLAGMSNINHHQQQQAHHPESMSIQLVNLKQKKISQNSGPSQKKLRNNSKGQAHSSQVQGLEEEGGPSSRYQTGPIQNMKGSIQIQSLQQQQNHSNNQNSQHYRQIQHQLALLNSKNPQLNPDYSQKSKIDHLSPQEGVNLLQQQYSSQFKNVVQTSLDSIIPNSLSGTAADHAKLQQKAAAMKMNMDSNMLLQMQQQSHPNQQSPSDPLTESLKQQQLSATGSVAQQNASGASSSGTAGTLKGNHRKTKSQLNQPNGVHSSGGAAQNYQSSKVQQIKLQDGSIRNLIHQLANNNTTSQNQQQHANSSSTKAPLTTHSAAPVGSSKQHSIMPMPSAPKSGNVLKLKQQVIRNKSSQNNRSATRTTDNFKHDNKAARGNSQTLQNTSSNTNQPQTQIMLQQQLQKKKILHTTKNTNANGQNQHNFDIVNASKEAQNTHQASVQHTSAMVGANTRKSQQTSHSIKIGATSGASLGSNFSKFTGTSNNTGPHYTQKFNSSSTGVNIPKSTGNNDNFIRSLMKEYEKSHQAQQFQLMQNKSGEGGPSINTQVLSSHNSTKHSQQHSSGQSASQSNKRGAIKVQKIQKNQLSGSSNLKGNQIDNIHKQMSQNQKTYKNMTQNLLNTNNTCQLMMQGGGSSVAQSPQTMQSDTYHHGTAEKNNINQQQIMVVKLKQKEARQSQGKGLSQPGSGPSSKQNNFSQSQGNSGIGIQNFGGGNNHASKFSSSNQQSTSNRRYSHQEQNPILTGPPQHHQGQSQKMQSQHSNQPSIGHFQTQDSRLMSGSQSKKDGSHIHSSTQATGINQQQSYTGATFQQHFEAQKLLQGGSVISTGNMDFNQNLSDQVQFKYSSKQNSSHGQGASVHHSGNMSQPQTKQYRNSGSMKQVKAGQSSSGVGQSLQKGYQTQVHSSGMSSASNTHQQMSIMNKYNKQQMFKQGKMTAQETRDRGGVTSTSGSGPGNATGPQRHSSAPREATYAPIDDEELRRQHLLNQSLDMSQLNALQSAKNQQFAIGYKGRV